MAQGENIVLLCVISWVDVHSPHISTAKLQTLKQSMGNTFETFPGSVFSTTNIRLANKSLPRVNCMVFLLLASLCLVFDSMWNSGIRIEPTISTYSSWKSALSDVRLQVLLLLWLGSAQLPSWADLPSTSHWSVLHFLCSINWYFPVFSWVVRVWPSYSCSLSSCMIMKTSVITLFLPWDGGRHCSEVHFMCLLCTATKTRLWRTVEPSPV